MLVNLQKERSSKDDACDDKKVETDYPNTTSNGPAADEPRGEIHQESNTDRSDDQRQGYVSD